MSPWNRIRQRVANAIAPPQRRHYEAGGAGGRWPPTAQMTAPASASHAAGHVVGSRIAWLAANDASTAAIITGIVTNAIGEGPTLLGEQPFVSAYTERFWHEVDIEGHSAGTLLTRAMRSFAIYGGALVHLTVDDGGDAARVRLLHYDQLARDLTRELPGGVRIVEGVEVSVSGTVRAYWLSPSLDEPFAPATEPVRFDADDIVHMFDPTYPGQMRGISPLAPVATALHEIARLKDARLASENAAALFGVLLRTPAGDFGTMADAPDPSFPSLEPGALAVLPPGYDAEVVQPPRTDGTVDFLKQMQKSAAAGAGVPYQILSGDLSDVNFSSARVGLLEFRRGMTALRSAVITPRLVLPIWRRWAAIEQLAGRLPQGDPGRNFVWPGWPAVDPQKETNADVAAIAAGLKSRHEVVGARGRDLAQLDAEIAADTFEPKTGGADVSA